MDIEATPVTLHPGVTYGIAGTTIKGADGADVLDGEGNPVILTKLTGSPTTSGAGAFEPDPDQEDDGVRFTASTSVGGAGELDFTAVGSDGKSYAAKAAATIVALDVEPTGMALVFTPEAA